MPEPRNILDRAEAQRRALLARIERVVAPQRLFRRLFFGADGEPTQDAVEFVVRLGAACFADASTFDVDPREHARREGRREIYLEFVETMGLDATKIAQLQRRLREVESE